MGLKSRKTSNNSPSIVSPLNITGPAIDRTVERSQHAEGREIEAKFFIPKEVAQKLVKGLRFTQIEQHYFRGGDITSLLEVFVHSKRPSQTPYPTRPETKKISMTDEFSSARIRRTRAAKESPSYSIEFKGSKEGEANLRISRREISYPITSAEYKSLKDEATAGAIRKRRYAIPGTITVNGQVIQVTAQVDRLQAAGRKLHKVEAEFDTVDIELHDTAHIHALRAGHHSFQFLENCIEISALDRKICKPLTTRRLAKHGLREDALKAVKTLEAATENQEDKATLIL